MREAVNDSFARSFALYDDMIQALPDEALGLGIPGVRSNSIGSQLWCVVGARESHARAIRRGAWQGFSCSLEVTDRRQPVVAALKGSAAAVAAAIEETEPTPAVDRLVIDLLEHEAAHQGQLIRYLYALDVDIPPSWRARFSLG